MHNSSGAVRLHTLSVLRDDARVVDDVSLVVEKGEIVSLVGPSGAGKSSLLLALAGLIPHKGLLQVPEPIGVVFQDHGVFPWLTVEGNIRFGLNRLSAAERRDRMEEVLEISGISTLRKRYPAQLSGGQRQRVAVARTLAARPGALLLDEPFASLDVLTRFRLAEWLRSIAIRLQIPVLMVSHDLDEAIRIADRLAVMVGGRIADLFAVSGDGRSSTEIRESILQIMGQSAPTSMEG